MRSLKRKKGSRLHRVLGTQELREPSSLVTRAQVAQAAFDLISNRLTVCFTGHRYLASADIPLVVQRLDELLELCCQYGYHDFLCGGALGFDMLAAERVLALRSKRPEVRLRMILPCSDQSQRWVDHEIARYERLLYAADDIQVLSPFYYEGCMQVRNRYMVDRSDLCICYFRHPKGGTASTVAYAVKKHVTVLNVAMEDVCAAFPAR